MKKHMLWFIILITCISCGLGLDSGLQNKQLKEPTYSPNYAWQLQLDGRRIGSQPYTEGQYLYLIEYLVGTETVQLVKIDMESMESGNHCRRA